MNALLHLNEELNHVESCLLWNTGQSHRLSFGLTQADHEPKLWIIQGAPLFCDSRYWAAVISTQQQRVLLEHTWMCESQDWPGSDAMQ